jgi:GH24 family phage-related lysozyme (muramidase)
MPAPLRDVPQEGIELIKSFEGIPDGDPSTVNIDAYLDPVGIWTIGWGHAIPWQGDFLRGAANKATARSLYPGGITKAQAETLLRGDLVDTAAGVSRLVQVALDDGQFGALVSFAFNAGLGNLGKSTLLRLLNGGDYAGAAQQFLVWDKGRINGVLQSLPGLTRRRRAERALFLGEDWRAVAAQRSRSAAGSGRAKPEAPAAKVKPRGRTTTPTASPPPPPAAPRKRRTAR